MSEKAFVDAVSDRVSFPDFREAMAETDSAPARSNAPLSPVFDAFFNAEVADSPQDFSLVSQAASHVSLSSLAGLGTSRASTTYSPLRKLQGGWVPIT